VSEALTLDPQPSTLNPQPQTLNPQLLNAQRSTLNPLNAQTLNAQRSPLQQRFEVSEAVMWMMASTINPQPPERSTLNHQPSTAAEVRGERGGDPRSSSLNPQPQTLNPPPLSAYPSTLNPQTLNAERSSLRRGAR